MQQISELLTTTKTRLYQRKPEWAIIKLANLLETVSKLKQKNLQCGREALYAVPVFTDEEKEKYYWLILDIESKSHGDIGANIQAAQHFLLWVNEEGLTEGLQIMLTGRGFRFIWPMIVPPEYAKGFRRWINDPDFDVIDAAPQLRGGHMRILGYRGNTRQGTPELDAHSHLLASFNDIMSLTADEYNALVKGTIPGDAYIDMLAAILPDRFITYKWMELFEGYNNKARLEIYYCQHWFEKSENQKITIRSKMGTNRRLPGFAWN